MSNQIDETAYYDNLMKEIEGDPNYYRKNTVDGFEVEEREEQALQELLKNLK